MSDGSVMKRLRNKSIRTGNDEIIVYFVLFLSSYILIGTRSTQHIYFFKKVYSNSNDKEKNSKKFCSKYFNLNIPLVYIAGYD